MENNLTQQNIPSEWKALTFKDLGISVIDGDRGVNYPNHNDFSNQGHCLFLNAGNVTKNGFKFSEVSFITEQKDKEMGKGKLSKDDLVITTRGTIGNIAHYSDQILYKNIRINSGMAIMRNSKENVRINTNFLSQYFNSSLFSKELKRVSFGSAQPQLTIQIINKFVVKIPEDKFEQKRIVAVLETWDQAIEKLKRKIEVKKEIKKGLMQELLTGKRRILGFRNDWELVSIGEIFSFVRTYAISRDNLVNSVFDAKRIGNIHYGDLHTKFLTEIDLDIDLIPQVKNHEFIAEANDYLKDGDLIMADASEDYEGVGVTVSIHNIKNKKVVGGLHTFVLRDSNSKTSEKYRQFIFKNQYIKKRLKEIANGVSVYGISKSNISKIVIALPPKQEQVAIADVLTRSDKEIKLLNQKLLILRDQKKYLLNNLVTGTIRTPETLSIPK